MVKKLPRAQRASKDPTHTAKKVKKGEIDFKRRLKMFRDAVLKLLNEIPKTRTYIPNADDGGRDFSFNARRFHLDEDTERECFVFVTVYNRYIYTYDLDEQRLLDIGDIIKRLADRSFMVGENGQAVTRYNNRDLWLMKQYVNPAYAQGTEQARLMLDAQVEGYPYSDLDQLIFSDVYQRRVGLLAAREFEIMQGFTADIVRDTQMVLSEGMLSGQNVTNITKTLNDRINVGYSRARRIVQTEVPGALRRANWQESEASEKQLGIKTKQLWLSALKTTTRPWHASRHGEVYSIQDVKDFYSESKNSINCFCAQTVMVVDEEGNLLTTKLQKTMLKQKERWQASQGIASTVDK